MASRFPVTEKSWRQNEIIHVIVSSPQHFQFFFVKYKWYYQMLSSSIHYNMYIFGANLLQFFGKWPVCITHLVKVVVSTALINKRFSYFTGVFDARGLRPDMLRFLRFSVQIHVYILWHHSSSVNVITQTQGKRSMSGLSPLASYIIGKTSILCIACSHKADHQLYTKKLIFDSMLIFKISSGIFTP